MLKKVGKIYVKCSKTKTWFVFGLLNYIFFKITTGANIFRHQKSVVIGKKNLYSSNNGLLLLGVDACGFSTKYDITLLNLEGTLSFFGLCRISRGCRIDVGKGANLSIGEGTFINDNCKVVAQHNIEIGSRCAIGWGCEIVDDNFHDIWFENQLLPKFGEIVIGDDVWLGSNVTVLRGVKISSGSVVASGAVVTKVFDEPNCLIGGVPARVLKRNIRWEI